MLPWQEVKRNTEIHTNTVRIYLLKAQVASKISLNFFCRGTGSGGCWRLMLGSVHIAKHLRCRFSHGFLTPDLLSVSGVSHNCFGSGISIVWRLLRGPCYICTCSEPFGKWLFPRVIESCRVCFSLVEFFDIISWCQIPLSFLDVRFHCHFFHRLFSSPYHFNPTTCDTHLYSTTSSCMHAI